jgi:hypothetical protein
MARDGETISSAVATNTVGSLEEMFEADMYLCLWFATLYIVVEGWPALRAKDETLTRLLRSPYKELLKDFRDAVFHSSDFQDSGMNGLIDRGRHSMDWVREVTAAFEVYLRPIAEADRRQRRYRTDP